MTCCLELKLRQYKRSGIGKTPRFLNTLPSLFFRPRQNCKPSTFILFSVNLLLLSAFLFLLMSLFSFAYDFPLSQILHGPRRLNFTVMEPGRQYFTNVRNVSYHQQFKWSLEKQKEYGHNLFKRYQIILINIH